MDFDPLVVAVHSVTLVLIVIVIVFVTVFVIVVVVVPDSSLRAEFQCVIIAAAFVR